MNRAKRENYFIDFLRFIFSIIIMLYHSWSFAGPGEKSLFHTGYLAVNFYFILTGYLMMNSLEKNNRNTVEFMKNKIKRLIPGILVTFFICYAFTYGSNGLSIKTLFSNKVIADLLLLRVTGSGGAINAAWWYLSTMLFTVGILYPIVKKYGKKYIWYIGPLLILVALTFINYYDISLSYHSGTTYLFINGFYKAIIYITLGSISYELAKYFKNFQINKFKVLILTMLEIFIYGFIIYNMNFNLIGSFYYAIFLTLGVAISFSEKSFTSKIFRCKLWKNLGNFGFYLYLTHASIRTYMLRRNTSIYFDMLPKYIILSLIVALGVYIILDIIYPFIRSKRREKLNVAI